MSFLKRIPFLKPRVRPVGDTLEAGDAPQERSRRRRALVLKGFLFSAIVVVTMLAFPRGTLYQYTVEQDEIWRRPNLHARFTFAIQKPADELEREREQVRQSTLPIFQQDLDATTSLRIEASALGQRFDRLLGHYASYVENRTRGRIEEALQDSLSHAASIDSLGLRFTQLEWQMLRESYINQSMGLVTQQRQSVPAPRLDRVTLAAAEQELRRQLGDGIITVSKSSISSDSITVRVEQRNSQNARALVRVRDLNEALQDVSDRFASRWLGEPLTLQIAEKVYGLLVKGNLILDVEATERTLAIAESEIVPTEGIVRENEVIVRQGDRVTADIMRKLGSLKEQILQQSGGQIQWKAALGHFLVTIASLLIFYLYLYLLRKSIFQDNAKLTLITLLFLGVIAIYGVALRAALIDMYVVPVAIVAILLTVMFDSRVALFGSLSLAFIGSHLLNYDFSFTFATVFASTLGIFSVRDIRNRSQFFISASVVFSGYLLVLTADLLLQNTPTARFTDHVIFVGINSVLLLLAYPALWIFERVFDVTTDLTLLELSDTNRPILKELSLKAPGTFNHVLQVANLSESAAASIGANALLTRVGALYHDIGKMVKPEYFVENQRGGVNPHDGLKPRMSALIIASHVKEGIEMARRIRLPQEVEDFIPMHHGTTRIEYFYQRALSQHKEGDPAVQESGFRYPGPRPHSKETSILMLADGIEAASRALENPSRKRLEGLIDSIVEARLEDGQLDNTNLTFRELNTIKESMLSVLTGIYHVRVKYPEGESPASDKWSGDQAANALDG
jgi:putative nucleotidyltransferase with HDIG domain